MFIMSTNGVSGAEKVNFSIIKHLEGKYDFYYVSTSGSVDQYLRDKNIKQIVIDKFSKNEIKKAIEGCRPDIIHATDYRASVMASFCSKNVPIVSHLHNNPPWIKKINKNSFAYLLASRKFKKIFTVSDSIKNEYIFSKFISNKIINISNPLSVSEIVDVIDNADSEKKYDVCFVGRINEQKDPFRYVDIINNIKERKPDIRTIMIGGGKLFNDVKEYIEKNNLQNNITMIGFVKNPFVLMKESKIFCLPSRWEGFGLVAFESLALGLPAITTPVGGLVDIVDNECGCLCNTNEEFSNNILMLLENEENYNRKSSKAIEKSLKLENIDSYMNKIDEIYKLILE